MLLNLTVFQSIEEKMREAEHEMWGRHLKKQKSAIKHGVQ